MSEKRPGDAALTDPRVLAAWRAASVEEPSAGVDQGILAAAHAAVQESASGRPAPARDPWWQRWQSLAAAAAVTGLAFVLMQSLPREAPVRAPSVTPAPPGPAAREMAAPAAAPEVRNEKRLPAPVEAPATEVRQDAARQELEVSGVAVQATEATDAAAVAAERPAAPVAPAASPGSAALGKLQGVALSRAADDWVARIVDRHAAGDLGAAAADLRAFRAAYPDADSRLPESLRAWAATVTSPEAP